MAAALCAKAAITIQDILDFTKQGSTNMGEPIDLYVDNDATRMASAKGYPKALEDCRRSFGVSIGFLCDLADNNVIALQRINTDDSTADVFAKVLPRASHGRHLNNLQMR